MFYVESSSRKESMNGPCQQSGVADLKSKRWNSRDVVVHGPVRWSDMVDSLVGRNIVRFIFFP
jgi:hypothetical protein